MVPPVNDGWWYFIEITDERARRINLGVIFMQRPGQMNGLGRKGAINEKRITKQGTSANEPAAFCSKWRRRWGRRRQW